MPLRTLPSNIEAENSVLGSCFLSKYAMQKASENLTPDSFYDDKNKNLFSILLELMEEGTPLDITTVTSRAKKKKPLN